MLEKIEDKKVTLSESIKHKTKILHWIVLLIIYIVFFVNVKVIFTVLDYIPSFSITIMLSIITGLIFIGFYLSRKISLHAINNLVVEINKRGVVEENLKKANEELSKTVKSLQENIAERKKIEEKLYTVSITDELTGLLNRRGFFTLAEHRLKLAKRDKASLLLLYADLDDFKEINDVFGHEEGDKLLKETANMLKACFRDSDITARIGGDEFVVFPIGKTQESMEIVTSRLHKKVEDFNANGNHSYKLSLSVGISAYDPESVNTIDGLLGEADRLMYEHKMRKKVGKASTTV